MPETEDLYEILHLHPSAHPDVIQAAYRRLALLYHPDKNPSPQATEMMAAVNRAYAVLSDPEKRAEYDRSREQWASIGGTTGAGAAGASVSSSQNSYTQGRESSTTTSYFTFGSSKEEVRKLQGLPLKIMTNWALDRETWLYEFGIEYDPYYRYNHGWRNLSNSDSNRNNARVFVDFSANTGQMVGWKGADKLKVHVVPGSNTTDLDYFTYGSHKDDIARLHGTPQEALIKKLKPTIETWDYGRDYGFVDFKYPSGLVYRWSSTGDGFKVPRMHHASSASDTSKQRESTDRGASTSATSNWRVLGNEPTFVSIGNRDATGYNIFLVVRFKDGKLGLFVAWRTEISYSETTNVNYQIDSGPTWCQSWYVGTDRESIFMPEQDIAETIRALFDAREFTVRVYPFGGNPLTASFDVCGFSEAVSPVLEAWRRAGSPAPGAAAQGRGCFLLPVSVLSAVGVAVPAIWFLL